MTNQTPFHALQQALGHTFQDPALLRQALTHGSACDGAKRSARTYERLEFLGDRILGAVVAEMLFHRFDAEAEGALAKRHAALVRREACAEVAARVGLGDHVILSASEEERGGRANPSLLADVCEAVIAALYLDGGMAAARRFIEAHWTATMEAVDQPPQDAKTTLQEWAQGGGRPLPAYRLVGQDGPAHEPVFHIEVVVEGLPPAAGEGPNKQAAEQAAAAALLARLAGNG